LCGEIRYGAAPEEELDSIHNVLLLDVDETDEYRVAGRHLARPRLNPPFPTPVDQAAQMEADAKAIMPLVRSSPTVRRFMK
jgi:hypothetical protein